MVILGGDKYIKVKIGKCDIESVGMKTGYLDRLEVPSKEVVFETNNKD